MRILEVALSLRLSSLPIQRRLGGRVETPEDRPM